MNRRLSNESFDGEQEGAITPALLGVKEKGSVKNVAISRKEEENGNFGQKVSDKESGMSGGS